MKTITQHFPKTLSQSGRTRFPQAGKLAGICGALVLLTLAGTVQASPDASTGKSIAGQCAACHGSDGKATNSQYPNLAGQNYRYLTQQLEAFKKGSRQNAIMHSMASSLSKQQIQDLAAYYSGLTNTKCDSKK